MPHASKLSNLAPLEVSRSEHTIRHLRQMVVEVATDDQLYQALSKIRYHEQQVLIRYYGLDGGDYRTLRVIGQEVDSSPERVRQIRVRAESRLRRELHRTLSLLGEAEGGP